LAEDQIRTEIERANLARAIQDNPLFDEYFEATREALIASWEKASDPEYREDVWRYVQLLGQFQKHIKTTLDTGKMAEIALAEMRRKEQ
jgi:uncharacterized membrane protein YccC